MNRSPLETNLSVGGVVRENYVELVTIEPKKKSLLCCFGKKRNLEPRIVEAQLVAVSSHEKLPTTYLLRFHSLKRGFKRKLDLELQLGILSVELS